MSKIESITSILLSIQRALLGEITPNIRGITCALKNSQIKICCYFEGQITEENEESMDSVEAEIMADFPEYTIDLQCEIISMYELLEQHRLSVWVYKRKE